MLTSVVIPCLDRAEDTRACLAALRAQRDAGAIEVVLVDNGSRDPGALLAAAQAFPHTRVVTLPRNLGFAGGVNRGLAAARGDLLLVLNNDTLPAPHMLARLLRARQAQPMPVLLAPVSNYVKGSAQLAVGNLGASPQGRAQIEHDLARSCGGLVQDVDALAGLCLLFDRQLLAQVGGFDEVFGLGNFEDDDLSLRVRLRGGRLAIARDAFVHHHGSRTFAELGVDYHAILARNQEVMAGKWAADPAYRALGAAGRGDTQGAAHAARQALALYPQWPEGQLFCARAALERRDAHAAQRHAEQALARCPNLWNAQALRIAALAARGALAEAANAVSAAIDACFVEPSLAGELLAHLALRCAEQAQPAAAVSAMQASLEIHADATRSLWLGDLLLKLGRLSEAEAAYQQAEQLGHEAALGRLGACQWREGRFEPALRNLVQAAARHPNDPATRNNLGVALTQLADAGIDVERAQALLTAVR